eukprot:2253190-Rhodomonas_salina.1
MIILSLHTAFVPPAYQPAVARRKFLCARSPVQFAYNQSAVQTARPRTLPRAPVPGYPPRGCTGLPPGPGVPGYPGYASTL